MSTIRNPNRTTPQSSPQRYVPEWKRRGTGRESVEMDDNGRIIDSKFERPGSAIAHGGTALNVGSGSVLDHGAFIDGKPVEDGEVDISDDFEIPPQTFKYPQPRPAPRTPPRQGRSVVVPQHHHPPPKQPQAPEPAEIAPGEFVVMFGGEVVEVGPLETVRHSLTKILLGQDTRFQDMDLEPTQFVVLKRVEIDFGLIIKD